MATAVRFDDATETVAIPRVVRSALILGVVQALCVLLVSLVNRSLAGVPDMALTGVVVALGAAATIFLPAMWIRPRSIDGVGACAGIGIGAALAFLLIDVFVLQPIGTYTNRWHEIGGGSNWWYHPVWWMLSCYLAWMGGWIGANNARRSAGLANAALMVAVFAVVFGAIAAIVRFPGATWSVATFAIAVLPALAATTFITDRIARRS